MRIGDSRIRFDPLPRTFAFSMLVHCAAIGLLGYKSRGFVAPMLMPGDAHGSQMTLTYLPGRAPQAPNNVDLKTPVRPVEVATAKLSSRVASQTPIVNQGSGSASHQATAPSPNKNSLASANPDSASGADALGTGNINIAYLDSFRSPRPDLSSLPNGTSGEVILDITIDTTGRIIGLKKLSGVGYGVDESVIATVQGWIFHPATKDGTPVVSEQELHFHYERGRNA